MPAKRKRVIKFQLSVPATVRQAGAIFISCCPDFDVLGLGATEQEALDNLEDALRLFILFRARNPHPLKAAL